MTYEEARAFLEDAKQFGSVLGLASIKSLMGKLSNVQDKLKIIHVAGTNGKGSVCAMFTQILQEAGYLVGTYASPAVFAYEEIFKVNGVMISQEEYASCMERIKTACEELVRENAPHPTAFEMETALAFLYFYRKKCEIVVLETGMGGATDATNLIRKPLLSVITDISRDHMAFLGDSLREIAAVKAGIMKNGVPVVCAKQAPEVMEVLKRCARDIGARLFVVDEKAMRDARYDADGLDFVYVPGDGRKELKIHLSLTGEYQKRNVLLTLLGVGVLRKLGYAVADDRIVRALCEVCWQGRFETICKSPRIILDGAHNEGAAKALSRTIENCFTNCPITYIIGVLADKEHEKMLKLLLPYARRVYTVTPENARAFPGKALGMEAKKYHPNVTCETSVAGALRAAIAGANENEVILVFGSLSYLKEVKEAYMAWRKS